MAKKDSVKKWVDTHEKKLRAEGWMTVDEFITKFSYGLKEYLHTNWKSTSPEDVLHPEDLTSNMLSYAESVFSVIGIFGAGSTNARD